MGEDGKASRADEDLLQSLKRFHTVLQGLIESPKGVVVFVLDHQYRYVAFNRNHYETMKRIWGADIALGDCMLDCIQDPEDRNKAKANFDRALSGESFTLVEAYGDARLERRFYEDIYNPIIGDSGAIIGLTLFLTDITEKKRMEEERDRLIADLRDALAKVKMLSGLLPVCAGCKRIRNDKGDWEAIEVYIRNHSDADFSHSICPECARNIYPELYQDK